MNLKDVKHVAAERGVKVGKMKKTEIIRTIQAAEGNTACYETGTAAGCGQSGCLWREDCR